MSMRFALRHSAIADGVQRAITALVLTVALLVCFQNAFAQFGAPHNDRPRPIRIAQRFSFDVLSFMLPSSDATNEQPVTGPKQDSDRVDVYIAVPYRSLSFLYAVDKYVADYGAIVQITDQQTRTMISDKYQTYNVLENVSAHEDREARSIERADAEQFSFHLPAGRDYEIRIDIQDLSTHHDYDTVFRYSTKSFASNSTALSDLMFYRSRRGDRILPSIGPDVSSIGTDDGGVFAELYHSPPDTVLALVSEIVPRASPDDRSSASESADNVLHRTVTLLRTPARSTTHTPLPVFQELAFDDLWMGRYTLHTDVLPSVADTSLSSPSDLHKRAIAEAERPLEVHIQRGIPITAADLDQALDQIRLIATSSEWDSLDQSQNVKEKREALMEFWRKRNLSSIGNQVSQDRGNQPMRIFYSRVQYANDHFGGSFQPGWKTDRGRVYIALGPPEYVDKHAYDAMHKPYEDWQYSSLGVHYTFVDPYMLGDYQLVGPPPAPGTFIWN